MRPHACLCAAVTLVPTRTRVLVLRHAAERHKPSSTARLAALALPGCRLVDYGDGPLPELDLADTWLLYPDGASAAARPPPAQLLVLDGTWQQARRMLYRIPELRALPRLTLPAHTPLPHLRRQPRAGAMSTLEAIARALALLEGDAIAAPLEKLLDQLVSSARRA